MSKKPIITATQKEKKIPFTKYQLDIMESIEKMKSCDIIISIKKDRTPGPHLVKLKYNGKRLIHLKK